MPKRVYVSYTQESDPVTRHALTEALTQAGHELERRWAVIQAAIVIIGETTLASAQLAHEARELLEKQEASWFPVVPLLEDGVSLADLRASGLRVLAGVQMSTAATMTERIQETLTLIERPSKEGVSQPSANVDHPFTTIRTINAAPGGGIGSIAFGEVQGHPAVAVGNVDGTVQLWRLDDQTATPRLVVRRPAGAIWAMALGRVDDTEIILAGGERGPVDLWAATTGEPLGDLPADGVSSIDVADGRALTGSDDASVSVWNLREAIAGSAESISPETGSIPLTEMHRGGQPFGMVTGVVFVDAETVTASFTDGMVRAWNQQLPTPVQDFGADSDAMMAVAAFDRTVFGGNDDGSIVGWDIDSTAEVHRFGGHSNGVRCLTAGLVNAAPTLVSGGKDNLVRVWDLASGVGSTLAGHTGTIRGVAIGHLDGRSVIISGADDGTVRIWGDSTADHVEWLSDSPADHDLLVRRPLARSIATRLRRMNDDEPGTSFLVHIDGPWGTGKSTLMRFLEKELEPDFTPVHFNAWSEAGVGPAWWALLTALRTSVGKQRRWPGRTWLRVREAFARLRRVGAPFVLAFIGLLLAAGLIWWLVNPSFAKAQDVFKSVTGILAMIGTVGAGALVASRFLLWDSARGAKLFEQHNTNPMLEVTRHFGWIMARSRKPVVFFIDDLDRCPDTYVVELLDNVQTLVRDASKRSAHFIVAADGAWIRTSYEQAYEKFSAAVSAPGQPLGYLFLDKFFQLRIPVPSIDAPRQQQYLRELLRGPVAPPQELAVEEDRVRQQLTQSTTEAQVVKTLQGASAEVRDRVAGTALDKLSTPAAVAATEHSLQRFAPLLPPNPRTMKRFVNAYSAMRAVRTLEGNPVGVEALALWTIIEIRWPSLADHLRARPESIELVGKDDLGDVPEELRVLFDDAALKLIVQSDFSAEVIRSCCGTTIPVTDR